MILDNRINILLSNKYVLDFSVFHTLAFLCFTGLMDFKHFYKNVQNSIFVGSHSIIST